jgi:mannose-6-phosphate isomerase-like protein (cupin superfamily)
MKQFAMILAIGALALPGIPALAQSGTKAQVFTTADLDRQLTHLSASAKVEGSSGSTLGDYGSHALKLSVRGTSGGAEVHAHFDDVMVIEGGAATLVTSGTVIDPKTAANGETKGTGIRGGLSRKIAKGDVVYVPAGTPHQLLIPKGTIFSAFVVKIRE